MLVVWTTQRTGSTWLCQMLDGHPEVRCFGEVYHPEPVAMNRTGPPELMPDRRFCEFPGGHRAYHAHLADLAGGARLGYKLMYNQASPRLLASLLGRARMIHLRRDPLDSCLSEAVMEHTGTAHSSTRLEIEPFAVDPVRFRKKLATLQRRIAIATAISRAFRSLDVNYADLARDRQRELSRIFDVLGLAPHAIGETTTRKIRPDYRDVITNYDALAAAHGNA